MLVSGIGEFTMNNLRGLVSVEEIVCSPNACVNDPEIPFLNGGSSPCENTEHGQVCDYVCQDGYEKRNSDALTVQCNLGQWDISDAACDEINECQTLPCQNGATCEDLINGYSCHCTPNYYGEHCSETHDDCTGDHRELCANGDCVDRPRVSTDQAHYSCSCHDGWSQPEGQLACSVENRCSAWSMPEGMIGGDDTDGCPNNVLLTSANYRTCTLKCLNGYDANSESNVLTCPPEGGTASTSFRCTPSACVGVPDISNVVSTSCVSTASGSSCAFECDAGYTASGTASCLLGEFQAGVSCNANSCVFNPSIANLDTTSTSCSGT